MRRLPTSPCFLSSEISTSIISVPVTDEGDGWAAVTANASTAAGMKFEMVMVCSFFYCDAAAADVALFLVLGDIDLYHQRARHRRGRWLGGGHCQREYGGGDEVRDGHGLLVFLLRCGGCRRRPVSCPRRYRPLSSACPSPTRAMAGRRSLPTRVRRRG